MGRSARFGTTAVVPEGSKCPISTGSAARLPPARFSNRPANSARPRAEALRRPDRGGVASVPVDDLPDLLHRTAAAVAEFRAGLPDRPVGPPVDLASLRAALGGPLAGWADTPPSR